MDNLIKFFEGNKTYVVALAIGVVAAAHAAGFISQETKTSVDAFLYPLVAVTLRHAIAKGK